MPGALDAGLPRRRSAADDCLPVNSEVLLRATPDAQSPLPLEADGVSRWVWEGRYGAMLIEVSGDDVYVNGQRVEPHPRAPGPAAAPSA